MSEHDVDPTTSEGDVTGRASEHDADRATSEHELAPGTSESEGPREASRGTTQNGALRTAAIAVVLLGVLSVTFAIGRCSAPDGGEASSAQQLDAAGVTEWTCSMHPQIRQPEPGDCPICGMDLIPVGGGEEELEPGQVVLSERAKVLARVRTSAVLRRDAHGAGARLLGRVEVNESTLSTVTAWIGGRIDRLHVTTTGQPVRRGQVIATLYSPEIYGAQQDLLVARRQLDRLAGASELARTAAESSRDAARQRLLLLGLPAAEVERMERASAPGRQVAIRSPFGGTVIERMATEGTYVETGAELYRIADLSRLWVQLDAYESDLGRLSVGQTVDLEVEAMPGESFEGTVAFIDPLVDRERRTARVRVEVSNAAARLRPGMFVTASVRAPEQHVEGSPQPLVIPASAPLFTGRRSVVYVELPGADRPTYQARVVRLGPRVGDQYPVVAGLSEGERVVTQGAFAIDADLQIRGGDSMMAGGDDTTPGPYDEAIEISDELRAALRSLFEPYLDMQARLGADDLAGAKEAARRVATAVGAVAPSGPAAERWSPIAQHLRTHATRAADATSIEAVRGQFEPLSERMASVLRIFGNPLEEPVRLAFCPMAFDDRGAEWIQRGEAIDNAYFGASMRTCGAVRATVEPGSHLPSAQSSTSSQTRAPAGQGHSHGGGQ